MKKTNTDCCALCQLSGLDNNTTSTELDEMLWELSNDAEVKYYPGDKSGKGQTSVFVITTPNEKKLRKLLKNTGFKKIHVFDRRTGYPEGKLKMYIKNL